MKAAVPWLLTAFGAFVAFILFLNLRERDYYEGGSLAPVAGDPAGDPVFSLLFAPEIRHSCPTCGECVHPVEVVENRRTLQLHDHDGWYKLFWAGDETYYFEELQHLAACYENRTAEDPRGEWVIRTRVGPAAHGGGEPHECGAIPARTEYRFELVVQDHPIVELAQFDLPPALPVITYRYDGDKLPPFLYYGWRPASPPNAGAIPCPCGKP